jgi:hypothetical protein
MQELKVTKFYKKCAAAWLAKSVEHRTFFPSRKNQSSGTRRTTLELIVSECPHKKCEKCATLF